MKGQYGVTRDESIMILSQIYNLYSGKHIFKTNLTKQDLEMNLAMFDRQFKTFDVRTVQFALDEIVSNRVQIYGFGNLIGALKEAISSHIPKMDAGEAWEKVYKSASCDRSRAKERFEALPCDIQQALGGAGFLIELGWSSPDKVKFFRADFEKKYEIVQERQKAAYLLGQKTIEQLQADATKPRLKERESSLTSVSDIMKGLEYGKE